MTLSASERLRQFRQLFSSEDHVITVINADPDAIASAMAVNRLLWRRVATTTICHVNIINRPDNLAMVRLLRVKMKHFDSVDLSSFTRTVMVDSQPDHHERLASISPDVVIDHHPDVGFKAPYTDIRPNYGATATILTEYLRAAKIKPSVNLATGLYHAIKTDTSNFERQTLIEDIRAFQFLFRLANVHLARKIEQAEMRLDYLQYFQLALQNMIVQKKRIYTHLGQVINPDICVLVADFYMRLNSITWSIVSGIYDQKLIIILRNDGIRKNAGTVAHKGFGQFGSAGGHKSMARAELNLADLNHHVDTQNHQRIQRWIIDHIERRAGKGTPASGP